MSPTATESIGSRPLAVDAPHERFSRRRDPSARGSRRAPAPSARDSSTCASAKRNTTDAPSAHSPSAIAPATATIIRTWMSRRPAMRDVHARARRLRSGKNDCREHRAEPSAPARRPRAASAKPERGSHRPRQDQPFAPERGGGGRGSSCSSQARMPVWATVSAIREVVSFAASYWIREPLADHVGVERLEPGERLQPVLEDRDFLVAVHPLDLEDRFGVQLANGTGQPWPVTPRRASALA